MAPLDSPFAALSSRLLALDLPFALCSWVLERSKVKTFRAASARRRKASGSKAIYGKAKGESSGATLEEKPKHTTKKLSKSVQDTGDLEDAKTMSSRKRIRREASKKQPRKKLKQPKLEDSGHQLVEDQLVEEAVKEKPPSHSSISPQRPKTRSTKRTASRGSGGTPKKKARDTSPGESSGDESSGGERSSEESDQEEQESKL